MLSAALAYAGRGLPVFPCKPDKTPFVKGGFKSATTDEDQIRAWFGVEHPQAMIGLPTGSPSDLHVLDVDRHAHDGFQTLKKLDLRLDGVPQVMTPSGGSHFYHRLGGISLRNTAGKVGPGIDTRGSGGYVVVPPSRPDPKRPGYQFVNGHDLLAAPIIPKELVELLRDSGKPKPKDNLATECQRVATASAGSRNDVLNRAAFKLAKLVQSGKLEEQEVRDRLAKAALDAGLDIIEIERTIDSAFIAGKRESGHGGKDKDARKQGRALHLPDVEPSEEPVDGVALVNELVADVRAYVVLDDAQVDALALWVLHSYTLDATPISPRLAISSPLPGCGKTTLITWLAGVVRKPLEAINISAAATFRTIELVRPTLLVDEADTLLRDNEELRAVLNSGHRVGGCVIRTTGEDFEPRQFATWSACAIALIGLLPATLHSRAIEIALRRKLKEERVECLRLDKAEANGLARQCRRWAVDHLESLKASDPELPEGLYNRMADNWRPLVAVADAIGSDWPQRARKAALALSNLIEEDRSLGVELLADIHTSFATRQVDRFSSESLIGDLITDPEKAWVEFGKSRKPLTQRQLAALLKPFGIKPTTIRLSQESVAKGYLLAQFADAFARYLSRGVQSLQGNNATGSIR